MDVAEQVDASACRMAACFQPRSSRRETLRHLWSGRVLVRWISSKRVMEQLLVWSLQTTLTLIALGRMLKCTANYAYGFDEGLSIDALDLVTKRLSEYAKCVCVQSHSMFDSDDIHRTHECRAGGRC